MKIIRDRPVFEFSNLADAKAFALRAAKPMLILLGDAPYYWVASLADAASLAEEGYELLDEPLDAGASSEHS
jgi:hypothetical protein